jgi:hypothetical protein
MKQNYNKPAQQEVKKEKKAYQSPKFEIYGDLSSLTAITKPGRLDDHGSIPNSKN